MKYNNLVIESYWKKEETNMETDFSKGSVIGSILKLAVPMTLAQLINVLYNVVDRMYIGRMPENATLSLTGLGLALPIITIVIAFANLFGMGGAPLFSIARGAGDDEEAEHIMGNAFVLLISFGILLTLLGLLFKKPLLFLFGASESTFPYANDYITIYLLGSLFVMIGLGMNSFINAQGFGKIGMLTVAIGAVANIILDPIFIFGFNMGVQGAALATVISQILSAIWIIKFLTGKKALLKLKVTCFKLKKERVKKIVGLGLSGFIMAITNGAVQIVCNASLQFYGGDLYVGVMTIINTVRELVTMPVLGVTNSAQPVIGYNYGAKAYSRVKTAIKFMSGACILYTLVAWAVVHGFPAFFIQIFNHDEAIIQAGIPAMKIYFFGFFMMALQFAGQSVFVGLGKSKQAIFFSLFRKAIIVIPLTLVLPRLFGLNIAGVFMAEPISNFIGGAACFITMSMLIWPELNQNKTLQQNI